MRDCRVVVLTSPKGGVGKSSLSRNILVLASHAGRKVVGVDFDQQNTLATWANRRAKARAAIPQITDIMVIKATLDEWSETMKEAKRSADFIVVDTPPSVEVNLDSVLALSSESDLTFVPCQQTQDDVDSASPWMQRLSQVQSPAVFILNRANRRTKSYSTIRAKLLNLGAVCPVEIPQLEEIPFAGSKGLGVADLTRATSVETFESLWAYIKREVRA